jgi:hypothetical protein
MSELGHSRPSHQGLKSIFVCYSPKAGVFWFAVYEDKPVRYWQGFGFLRSSEVISPLIVKSV